MQSPADITLSLREGTSFLRASGPTGRLPRLIYLATSRQEGGLERSSIRLASLLQVQGAFILYVCHPGGLIESRCKKNAIRTAPLQVRNSGDFLAAVSLARYIQKHRIEIVHVHSRRDYVSAVLAVSLARRTAVRADAALSPRLLFHVHQIRTLGEPYPLSDRFFAWGVDQVVAVSEPVRARILQSARFPPDRVRVIENGVDLAAYAPPRSDDALARRRSMRRAWSIPENAPVIGMVGSLGEKGQAMLLQAMPALLKRIPDLRIVLAGPEKNPGEQERLRGLAGTLAISDRVILPGVIEDVPSCMAALDVLTHLPADEAFGLTIAEAMAAGVPVVASDVGGCRTVVHDGRTGYLVGHGDQDALIQRLVALLDRQEGALLRASLGDEGRTVAERRFALEAQVARLTALYQELLEASIAHGGVLGLTEAHGLGRTSWR